MGASLAKIAIALANIFLISALHIFATGFFPHKASIPGLATWPQGSDAVARSAPFDRVIFMVVDALRSDFVYGNASSFSFTQGLIRSGAAVPFTGHASPPTITMPRVKAITTGSVPSFVDLILNFAESDTTSTLKDQDTWLAQLRAKGGKLVMYGDDTWLRLFPDFFHRADGTTSFFVSDFTEVDNNVTRHISSELAADDWSAMTMHFLGLDHIGHKTGPKGPNMPAKQAEMDGIVKDIYSALETNDHLKSCLLVLLGDHGMNEGGNHGASSPGEVSTALTFISPKFKSAFEGSKSPINDAEDFEYYETVEQSDIVPTLAALLGFPVPLNNLGVIIPRLLELWTVQEDKHSLLYENAEQIQRIASATFPDDFAIDETTSSDEPCSTTSGEDAQILACLWRQISRDQRARGTTTTKTMTNTLKTFLYKAQTLLSGTASNYDLTSMHIGIVLGTLALALCIPSFAADLRAAGTFDAIVLVAIMLAHAGTMFASSYVEEEHQFWYWALGGWLVVMCCKDSRFVFSTSSTLTTSPQTTLMSTSKTKSKPNTTKPSSFLRGSLGTATSTILLLIIRRWRQTGQKYAGEPDLLSDLVLPNAGLILWPLTFLAYMGPTRALSRRAGTWLGGSTRGMGVLPYLVSGSAVLFKVAFTAADAPELVTASSFPLLAPLVAFVRGYPLVNLARVVFLGLAHLLACAVYYESPWKSSAHLRSFLGVWQDVLSIFLITQSRTVYVPLFLFFNLQLYLLRRGRQRSVGEITVLALLVQYASFFTFGGTNSIATIDLSNAYNGVSGYNIGAVGVLTFVSNWAGPIWWSFATCRLFSSVQLGDGSYNLLLTSLSTFACVHTLAVMVACLVLREHLFIWTVFSPKYLYTAAWVAGQHTVVNALGIGTLLWRRAR